MSIGTRTLTLSFAAIVVGAIALSCGGEVATGAGGAGGDDCLTQPQSGAVCKTEGKVCKYGGTSAYQQFTCTSGHWVEAVVQFTTSQTTTGSSSVSTTSGG